MEENIEEIKKQRDRYLAGWQRARADFLNYQKEEKERFGNILGFAFQGFILQILPILDNFDLVEKKIPGELKEDENVKGMLQIKSQILDFLKKQEVEEIKAIGEKFDPNLHEAVEQIKGEEPGIVLEQIQKGYIIHGQVLRPAKVKVSK